MGTGIGYLNEACAQMKGRYGAGKICTCLTSLIKTIGGEFPVRQRNANHNYAYTRLQHILSQDSSRTSALSSVSCTGLWRRQGTEARIVWPPYPILEPMLTRRGWRHSPTPHSGKKQSVQRNRNCLDGLELWESNMQKEICYQKKDGARRDMLPQGIICLTKDLGLGLILPKVDERSRSRSNITQGWWKV